MYLLFNKTHIIQLIYKKMCNFNINRLNFYMSKKNDILNVIAEYVKNIDLFVEKGNKSASTRARKALADLVKIAREERKFILEYRTNKPDRPTANRSTANRSTASTANRSTASIASTADRSTASTANRPKPTSPYEPKNLPTSDFYTTPTFNKYK